MNPTQRNTPTIIYFLQLGHDAVPGVHLSASCLTSYVLCKHCNPPHAPQDTHPGLLMLPAAQRSGFLPGSQVYVHRVQVVAA